MKNDKTFKLNIVTPEKVFFDDYVEQIIVDTIDGSRGILKDISPQLMILVTGNIKIFVDNQWKEASYGKGFISTKGGIVNMLVSSVNWAGEVGESLVDREKIEEEARKQSKKSYNDYIMRKANIKKTLSKPNVDELGK